MSYSWGSDSGPPSIPSSGGYDFGAARDAYRDEPIRPSSRSRRREDAKPSDALASRRGKTKAPVGKNLSTKSTHPIVIAIDGTGSMSEWPGIILEKLPLLGKEIERYAPKYAISFCVFGDSQSEDKFPLQVRDFDSDKALDEHIGELYPEGGGGDTPESQGLVAYYYLNHCEIASAVKPIFIFVTDAPFHLAITKNEIHTYTGDEAQSDLNPKSVMKKLSQKFTTYVVLKDYGSGGSEDDWINIFDAQHVLPFKEPRDIVEVLIGIIAGEVGKYEDFEKRSSKRHTDMPERVSRVKASLKSVKLISKKISDEEGAGKSKKIGATKDAGGKTLKSKKLI